MESDTGGSFTGTALQREDFYTLPATDVAGNGPAAYLGFFELDANGDLSFNLAPGPSVPEPMTYGFSPASASSPSASVSNSAACAPKPPALSQQIKQKETKTNKTESNQIERTTP